MLLGGFASFYTGNHSNLPSASPAYAPTADLSQILTPAGIYGRELGRNLEGNGRAELAQGKEKVI